MSDMYRLCIGLVWITLLTCCQQAQTTRPATTTTFSSTPTTAHQSYLPIGYWQVTDVRHNGTLLLESNARMFQFMLNGLISRRDSLCYRFREDSLFERLSAQNEVLGKGRYICDPSTQTLYLILKDLTKLTLRMRSDKDTLYLTHPIENFGDVTYVLLRKNTPASH